MRGRTAMWARQSLTRWRAAEGVQSVVVVWTHLAVLLKDRRSELGVHLQTRGKLGACPLGLQPLGPGVYVLLRDRLPTSLPVGHSSLSLSLSHTHTHTHFLTSRRRARARPRPRSLARVSLDPLPPDPAGSPLRPCATRPRSPRPHGALHSKFFAPPPGSLPRILPSGRPR